MQALKVKIAVFALKQAVKFLKGRQDLIPDEVDDLLIRAFAKSLGV